MLLCNGYFTKVHSYVVAIWREIVARIHGILYHMRWIVGDGTFINFMSDLWISDVVLDRWPTFFSMDIHDTISNVDFFFWSAQPPGGTW